MCGGLAGVLGAVWRAVLGPMVGLFVCFCLVGGGLRWGWEFGISYIQAHIRVFQHVTFFHSYIIGK